MTNVNAARRRVLFAAAAGFGLAGSWSRVLRAAGPADEAWERLKSLAGEWKGTYSDGQAARVSYRLVSNGTAILETLESAHDDQMMTIYHRDGAHLRMTHYCSTGTQSRMRASGLENGRLDFTFVDATNLASPADHHMTRLVMSFPGPGRLVHEWTSTAGSTQQTGRFEFAR